MPRRAELPNLTPARLDITHYRGDSLTIRLRMRHQGQPVDVSDWTKMEAHIRANPDGPEISRFQIIDDHPILDQNGDEIRDPLTGDIITYRQQGIIRLYLSEPSAQYLPPVSMWDFQVTETIASYGFNYDHVRTLVRGFIYAPADVTHPAMITPVATRRR
jgi:hypothetical protein